MAWFKRKKQRGAELIAAADPARMGVADDSPPEAELAAVIAAATAAASGGDGELTAVICAALAAYEADARTPTLVVRRLDRTAGVRPAWGAAGTAEAQRARGIASLRSQ